MNINQMLLSITSCSNVLILSNAKLCIVCSTCMKVIIKELSDGADRKLLLFMPMLQKPFFFFGPLSRLIRIQLPPCLTNTHLSYVWNAIHLHLTAKTNCPWQIMFHKVARARLIFPPRETFVRFLWHRNNFCSSLVYHSVRKAMSSFLKMSA